MESQLALSGNWTFEAKGKPAPKNFLRILSMVLDYRQRVTIDFDSKSIKFEDCMLPNRFLTLWTEPEITIGFSDLRKVSDDKLDGTEIFTVHATQGKAPLIAHRFEEFEDMRAMLAAIYEEYKQ